MSEPPPPPRTRRQRLRRLAWIALVVLVALPPLIVLATLAALRSEGVRQAILARISSLLAKEYGLAMTARDFSPLWLKSGVELRDVRLGAPGAAPVATARRARANIDLGSLWSRPLVVRSLETEGLRIDLAATLPKLPESPPATEAGPPVEIRRIVLNDCEVRGAPLAEPAAKWVRSWNGQGIDARGHYRGGRLELEVERGVAILDRPGFGLQQLQLAGHVAYEEKKPLRIEALRVTGDGLRLTASGTVGLEQNASTAARFDLYAEPHALATGLPRGGRLRAAGRIQLPEATGQVTLSAEDIPAEVLRPYLDGELYADLSLTGTAADVKAEMTLGPGWNRIAGTADASWRRGGRPLAHTTAHLSPGDVKAPIVAAITADLLPGSPGRRSVHGTLRAASWQEVAHASAENAQAEVRLPDVKAAFAEVRALWPRLVPAPPPGTPLQGTLTADAHLSGPLTTPEAVVDATWLPRTGSLVNLQAKGRPIGWSGSAKVRMEALPLEILGALAPGLAGTVTGTAELSGSPTGYRTRVDAATAALALPPSLQRLESGKVIADGTLILHPLSYRGAMSLDGAGLVALPNASTTARIAHFRLAGDGLLRSSPLRWNGKLDLNGEDAEVAGAGRADRFAVVTEGALTGQPLVYDGTLSLDTSGLERPGTARVDRLQLTAEGKSSADLRSLAAKARIDADRIVFSEPPTELRNLHAEAEGDGHEIRFSSLSGELPEGRTFEASGRLVTEPLLAEADLDLRLVKPVDAVTAASLTAKLRDGILELNAPRIDTASGPANLQARVPLGALRGVPQLESILKSLPVQQPQGPLTLTLAVPELDSEPLLAALGLEPRPERVRAAVTADLAIDLAAPAAGKGEVRLSALSVANPDGRIAADGPLVLRLGEGKLVLEPVHLRIDSTAVQGAGVDLQGSADLARGWRPLEDPLAAAVTRVSAVGSGTLDAALLNPYLHGGAALGSLSFSVQASGPADRLAAEVRASGPEASFVFPAAGLQVENPQLGMAFHDGRWTIGEGRMAVNAGTVDLTGGFSPAGGLDIAAQLSKVHYRLDYGIETLLSGRLALQATPEERVRLSGKVMVERGVLDRDLNLDREVLTLLFKPPATPSTEESALAAVDLDLDVETAAGVRIKNNVGDLRASWRKLEVGGTLENPVIRGRIDIAPGGLFYAYGQTVRIDRGSLLFTGDPLTDPKLDLATTSSLQDPTIARLRGGGPLALLPKLVKKKETVEEEEEREPTTQEILAAGLGGYYGARVLQRLGESVGLGGLSVVPDFENDPTARLIVGRDLSTRVSLALSIDLRNAERQTYFLYLKNLRSLPGLRIEGFTNDEAHEGANLQQAFDFGGGEGQAQESGPRLRRLTVAAPKKGASRREIRRAVGLKKKEPVPEGTEFTVEVNVADFLHRKRYPDPRIEVAVTPVESKPGWVDVAVTVEPGPRVSFAFEGNRPPRALRPEITSLYRTDFYEATSIEEMRQTTIRAFRSFGHLDPHVQIEVRRDRPGDIDGPRTVTILTDAGPPQPLKELEISGLPADDERLAAGAFPSILTRAELAAGVPAADARLLGALRGLGFAEARIIGRSVSVDGSRLVVDVEPGRRRTVASVQVVGVEEDERQRLISLLPLRAGDPLRVDRVAQGSHLLERALQDQGYADATAQPAIVSARGRTDEAALVYEVTPGPLYRLAGVELHGERWSRPGPLRRETGLAAGAPFSETALEEARNRLFGTGLFSRVDTDVQKSEGAARVSFSLAERPRFHLGYGVRWESEVGTAAVLDLVDHNFLGRAVTLGLRGLYETDDRSGRIYLNTGGILGTRISLESFAEKRRHVLPRDPNLMEDLQEASLQMSRPLGDSSVGRVYARYRRTHVFEIEPDPFSPIALDVEIRLPYLGLQLLRDTRDDPIDPRSGFLTSLDLSGSGTFLGSDFRYVRLFAQAASLRDVSISGKAWTWAQSVRLGFAHAFAGQEITQEERFFAGGPFSVRGYDVESLGPRESLGVTELITGGEALLVVNEELRVTLPWDMTGLAFIDAGQVWDRPTDADFDLAKSIGLGLRARSPVGLLRLDAAFPLDRRRGEPRYKLYLGFGNAF